MPNTRPLETELKLVLTSAGEQRLAEHADFRPPRASEPRSEHIITTYFDTTDRDLARRGLSLRVRRVEQKRIQAVKAEGNGGALEARGEWEWPIAEEKPDLNFALSTPVAEALPQIDERLEPVVVTDVVRTKRIVEYDGTTIEAALDAGSIEAGDASEPVHELELELREGAPAALYRLALALHAATPLAVEVESKAARGYRLIDKAPPHAEKPKPTTLERKVKAADGLRHVVADALRHPLTNCAAALAGDPEGIHQTRLAIRRLRSALRLFDPLLERHTLALFQDELKRMGRAIGEARDWDVFSGEMLPASFDGPGRAEWGALMHDAAQARRRQADVACVREIQSPSFSALVLGLAAWTEAACEQRTLLGDDRLDRKLSKIAPALLDRLIGEVRETRLLGSAARFARLAPSATQVPEETALRGRILRPALCPEDRPVLRQAPEGPAEESRRHQLRHHGDAARRGARPRRSSRTRRPGRRTRSQPRAKNVTRYASSASNGPSSSAEPVLGVAGRGFWTGRLAGRAASAGAYVFLQPLARAFDRAPN